MNSLERRRGRAFDELRINNAVAAQHRPVLSRGRRLEAAVDVQQLHGHQLDDYEGVAWPFMVGYSEVGGGDLLG